MLNRFTIVAVLLLLAGATRWWLQVLSDDPSLPPTPTVRSDYSLEQFQLWVADPAGQPRYQMTGPRLIQQANAGIVVEQPQLEIYQAGVVDWRVTAARAEVDLDRDQVVLKGDAKLRGGERLISAAELTVDNLQRIAHTPTQARIERGADWITGRGLTLDFDSERIELAADVVAHYEPQQ